MSSTSSSPSSTRPQLELNPILGATQHPVQEGIFSHILWDLREHPIPNAHYVQELGTPLSQATLSEFATNPPVPFLQITCEVPVAWNLVVTSSASPPRGSPISLHSNSPASSSSSSPPRSQPFGVTVYDVLRSIHKDLLTRIPPDELSALHEKTREKVIEAFERRWKTSIKPTPEEASREGVKKVDRLMQHTRFGGLSVDPSQEYTCILSLRRPS